MEKITFNVWNYGGDMCRIDTSDCRSIYRKMAGAPAYVLWIFCFLKCKE